MATTSNVVASKPSWNVGGTLKSKRSWNARSHAAAIRAASATSCHSRCRLTIRFTRGPRPRGLPPGEAPLRPRLTTPAAPSSPGPCSSYCPLRPCTASDVRGTRVSSDAHSHGRPNCLDDALLNVERDPRPERDREGLPARALRLRERAGFPAEEAQRRLEVERRGVVDGRSDPGLRQRLADAVALG